MLKKVRGRGGKGNRRGVSEMIAYVMLISIALGLAIGVYAWIKWVSNVDPPRDCKEGTSIILIKAECNPTGLSEPLKLTIKNNGLFNVDGVIVKIGNNTARVPIDMPKPFSASGGITHGHFAFSPLIDPGETKYAIFSKEIKANSAISNYEDRNIEIIQVQPYIINKGKVACIGATITEKLNPACHINCVAGDSGIDGCP